MKKFLFCLIITMAMLPSVFARTEIVEIDECRQENESSIASLRSLRQGFLPFVC